MSVSMFRGQVDRLQREIAQLEARVADERSKAARERSEALRIAGSISRTTSPSMAASKLKQAQQREERAVGHDKRAATHAAAAAGKGRQLTTSQASLDRALGQQRKKDDAEQRRRRDEELRHIDRLEAARRAAEAPQLADRTFSPPAPRERRAPAEYEYDVCLSFAGEDRTYVEMIAEQLKGRGLRVFYDRDEAGKLWGKDLVEHFDYIYRQASRYCVMFISEAYAAKPWARHERRSALARALEEEGEYILPARFDDTELPGLRPTVAYLDLRTIAPETLVEFIAEKLAV